MYLSEADTRSKLIDPALYNNGWKEDNLKREETAGTIEVYNGQGVRIKNGKIDYTLRVNVEGYEQAIAIALIEAKAENHHPTEGLEQVKSYTKAKRFNVPFVYSSNGHQFIEYNMYTGTYSDILPMSEFPSPEDLKKRYEEIKGFKLESESARPLLMEYKHGEKKRRYYQDAAIRAILEKLAIGNKRALISVATGAGKTFIAANLLKKIADAKQLRRALFICDRDELRNQALVALSDIFGADVALATKDDPVKNARIVIATYQTLGVEDENDDMSYLIKNYEENYFSHIIIDECHRSAWGKWSKVLTYNSEAVHVGLTATPKIIEYEEGSEDIQISKNNYEYFGEPVYEYDMTQAIEDGYLALYEIIKRNVILKEIDTRSTLGDIKEDKTITIKNAYTGKQEELTSDINEISLNEIDKVIVSPEKVELISKDLFNLLSKSGKPEQKTIIFCASDKHADDIAIELNRLYIRWCKENGKKAVKNFAFKCTSRGGGNLIPNLKGSKINYFIATTVDLLSTGIDIPILENIVFFRKISSPILFNQMVGRGTRIDEASGKLLFRLYDYTNATRLFGKKVINNNRGSKQGSNNRGDSKENKPIIINGLQYDIEDNGNEFVMVIDGKITTLTIEQLKNLLKINILKRCKEINDFKSEWLDTKLREEIIKTIPNGEQVIYILRKILKMEQYEIYDLILNICYNVNAISRKERKDKVLNKMQKEYNKEDFEIINIILNQFELGGLNSLENRNIFKIPEIQEKGGIKAIKEINSSKSIIILLKERLFEDEN